MGNSFDMRGTFMKWTNEEIEFLKINYKVISIHDISKQLNRSINSIHAKARLSGLSICCLKKGTKWKQSDIDKLKKLWPNASKKDIINAQNYYKVNILDPHSDVTTALINRCNVLPVCHIIKSIIEKHNYNTIIIPDTGATKKMFSYYFPTEESRKGLNFIQCLKIRDTLTGQISGFKICDVIPNNTNVFIPDDIIDGGKSAFELSKIIISQYKVNKMGGYFTHGIFSKGLDYLLETFNELYTTNSWKEKWHDKLFVYNII